MAGFVRFCMIAMDNIDSARIPTLSFAQKFQLPPDPSDLPMYSRNYDWTFLPGATENPYNDNVSYEDDGGYEG